MEAAFNAWWVTVQPALVSIGLKVLGAIIAFIVGRWAIHFVLNLVSKILSRQSIDPTIQRYLTNILSVSLNIVLFIVLLGYFGIETTSFAALLAGAGVAIGSAWGGLLSNFASGVFLVILRPFRVGEYVVIGGVEGTVAEIGLFGTAINSADNVRIIIGNAKILSNDIKNFAINPTRRFELNVQLDASSDIEKAIELLKSAIQKESTVLSSPAVDVEILPSTTLGPVIAIRAFAETKNFAQAKYVSSISTLKVLKESGFIHPQQRVWLTKAD